MSKRRNLDKWEKDEILRKQHYRCAGYPKGTKCTHPVGGMSESVTEYDHKVSRALTGNDDPSNYQALCLDCHRMKTREDKHKIRLMKVMEVKEPTLRALTLPQLRRLGEKYGVELKDIVRKPRPVVDGPFAQERVLHPTREQYIKALTKKKILRKDVDSVTKSKT